MSSCTITCSLFVKLQLRTNKRNDYFGLLYTLVLTSSTSLSTFVFFNNSFGNSFGGGGIISSFFENVSHRFSVIRACLFTQIVCIPAKTELIQTQTLDINTSSQCYRLHFSSHKNGKKRHCSHHILCPNLTICIHSISP